MKQKKGNLSLAYWVQKALDFRQLRAAFALKAFMLEHGGIEGFVVICFGHNGEARRIMTTIIDEQLLDEVSRQAQNSPRLRMNHNFHQSLDEKCHRMLNAVESGTDIPIHRHPTKDESFVILRGKVRSTTYNDDGSMIESVVLCQEDGVYGVNIPKGVCHKLESLESGSVIFECKEGPFVPHEEEGILTLR